MKSKKYIIVSLLFVFLATTSACMACGGWLSTGSTRFVFRIMPYNQEDDNLQSVNLRKENCRLWQQMYPDASLSDIEEAIYSYDLERWSVLKNFLTQNTRPSDYREMVRSNSFVRQIDGKKDVDAVRLLCLSKCYEEQRAEQISPWYYPCPNDPINVSIETIADSAKAHIGGRYAARYLFLAVKCLYATHNDAECLTLWRKWSKQLGRDCIYNAAEGYVAGCMFRLGMEDEATDIYVRQGDMQSLTDMGRPLAAVLESVYRRSPNSPFLPMTLQRIIHVMEPINSGVDEDFMCGKYYHYVFLLEKKNGGWNENNHYLNFSPKDLNDILALCERASKDRRVRNKAMWKYTAAAINMYQNHPDKALANLNGAEQGCRDKFLCRSVRMMRFNIHARYDSIDDNYYAMLYNNLRWIDKEMTDELRGLSQKDRKRIEDEYECEWNFIYRSIYTNDMLQYILFDGKNAVCRRQLRKGREVLALQLASMGGAMFEKRYYGKPRYKKREMFYLADGLSADTLRAFYQSALSPSNQMERFMAQRGVTDRDYWSDIIGTHLLRERRYQMAVNYLSACSDDYEDGLAIKEYCHYDPFDLNRKAARDKKHYRLSFAKEMAYHEKMMHQAKDANVRAEHQIMYSIGLENSMTRDWTLISYGYSEIDGLYKRNLCVCLFGTPYGYSEIDGLYKPSTRPYNAFLESEHELWFDDCWQNTAFYRKVGLWAADKLRDKAIDMYSDPEAKARGYARLYMIAQVMEELPNTEQGQFYARHCDQWKDYLVSK